MYWQYQIPELNLVSYDPDYSKPSNVWLLILKLKKLRYLMLDLKKMFEKSGFRRVRTQTNNETQWPTDPGWSGRWWRCWRDPGPQTRVGLQLTMQLKKRKNVTHLDLYYYRSWLLTFYWLGNRINIYQLICVGFLMWSQINVRSSIRLTVSQQIDFKDFKPLKAKKIL